MKIRFRKTARGIYAVVALALVVAVSLPILNDSKALAYGQVTTRSIQLSDSTASATNVNYLITFTPASATTIKGIVVDFCSNDPIIGDSCTAPTGFSVGTPTVTITSLSGETTTGWTAASANSGRTLELTNGSASGTPSGTTAFTLTTATNPSTTGTFYARIFTFGATADVTTWAGTADGSSTTGVVDAGGIALSTANVISITAKVQETLTFCVSKAAPANGCTSTTAPTLTLGHGSPPTLDGNQVDTDTAFTQVSSNATSGVVVNLKLTSSTACAGLSRDGGATCGIPAIGSIAAIPASTADFGLQIANGSGGSGTVSASSNYNDGNATHYAMRNQTFGTYGDTIESSTAPTANVNSQLTYAAQAALTTPAGIYTATHSLIATGTF